MKLVSLTRGLAMSATEKMQKNQPLTAGDIQELLKNPNSWLSKLLTECAITIEINSIDQLHYIAMLVEEERQILAQEKFDAIVLAQVLSEKQRADFDLPRTNVDQQALPPVGQQQASWTAEQKFELTKLKTEMDTLLNISQESMTQPQLAIHRQQLLTNYNQQLDIAIGSTITLRDGSILSVPKHIPKPPSSAPDFLRITRLDQEIASGALPAETVYQYRATMQCGVNPFVFRLGDVRTQQEEKGRELTPRELMEALGVVLKKARSVVAQHEKPLRLVLVKNDAFSIKAGNYDLKFKDEMENPTPQSKFHR